MEQYESVLEYGGNIHNKMLHDDNLFVLFSTNVS